MAESKMPELPEVVAWRYRNHGDMGWKVTTLDPTRWFSPADVVEPLYAHPPREDERAGGEYPDPDAIMAVVFVNLASDFRKVAKAAVLTYIDLAKEAAAPSRVERAGGEALELDPVLAKFYAVDSVGALLHAMERHIESLQDAARRNVKPWEDTFPPTLLPRYIRENGLPEPAPPATVYVYTEHDTPPLVVNGKAWAINSGATNADEAADAFWRYWRENGETHRHGFYESTWGAINAALRIAGVTRHDYAPSPVDAATPSRSGVVGEALIVECDDCGERFDNKLANCPSCGSLVRIVQVQP